MKPQRQLNKTDLRPGYAAFLNSAAGKDFIKHTEVLEKAFILQAIKGSSSEEKANSISRLEGMITLRDYILRMSKG
jgi:hypothetical protein